jgi:hypothetical protein
MGQEVVKIIEREALPDLAGRLVQPIRQPIHGATQRIGF